MEDSLLSLSAIISMIPAAIFSLTRNNGVRGNEGRNVMFWLTLSIAATGPLIWIFFNLSETWKTGLSAALWITIAASINIFTAITLLNDYAWRLTPLLIPYLIILAFFAFFVGFLRNTVRKVLITTFLAQKMAILSSYIRAGTPKFSKHFLKILM